MNFANVIDLASRRSNRAYLLEAKNATAQAIMETFPGFPVTAIEESIRVANHVLDMGGNFLGAMAAAEQALMSRYAPSSDEQRDAAEIKRNADHLAHYHARRGVAMQVYFNVACETIRERMRGRSQLDLHYAIGRARRELECGGSIASAVSHALNESPLDPDAA